MLDFWRMTDHCANDACEPGQSGRGGTGSRRLSGDKLVTKVKSVFLLLRRLDCNDGVSSYCETLMRSLIDQGCRIHVACGKIYSTPNTIGRYERMRGLADSWIEIGNAGLAPSYSQLRAVAAAVRKSDADVVNVFGFGALMWGRLVGLVTRSAVIATYLPSAPGALTDVLGADQRPFDARQRFFMRTFTPDRIISLSAKSSDFVATQFPAIAPRIDTIYCGINTDHFRVPSRQERADARAALGLDEQTLACAVVGRLDWNKGHDLLIGAVRAVRDTLGRPIHGFMAGSGHNEAEIRTLARQSPNDEKTLTVLGHVTDVRDVMWASDIFVLPSRLEGFGLVVVEAMACGVPAIRTPSGGASDQIIEGENGLIVPFEDVDALAAAILTLSDDDRRASFARRGLDLVRTAFDQNVVARQVLQCYSAAIAAQSR